MPETPKRPEARSIIPRGGVFSTPIYDQRPVDAYIAHLEARVRELEAGRVTWRVETNTADVSFENWNQYWHTLYIRDTEDAARMCLRVIESYMDKFPKRLIRITTTEQIIEERKGAE